MKTTKDPPLLDPKKATALLLLIFQCAVGIILISQRGCPPPLPELGIGTNSQLPTPNSQLIYVHVVGNVKSPGVYKFSPSSKPTVQDAVNVAGGCTAPVSIDMSLPLHDEEQVVIR